MIFSIKTNMNIDRKAACRNNKEYLEQLPQRRKVVTMMYKGLYLSD